jgi:hypothetical protein
LSGRISRKIRTGFLMSLNNSRPICALDENSNVLTLKHIEHDHHYMINRGILPLNPLNNAFELLLKRVELGLKKKKTGHIYLKKCQGGGEENIFICNPKVEMPPIFQMYIQNIN